jgi:hypothetical protein
MESINIADRDMLFWAGSPSDFDDGGSGEFGVDGGGRLNYGNVYSNRGVRGVFSLSSESKLLGRGTYNDVYTVN